MGAKTKPKTVKFKSYRGFKKGDRLTFVNERGQVVHTTTVARVVTPRKSKRKIGGQDDIRGARGAGH